MPPRVTPARLAALEALRRVRAGALADQAVDRAFRRLPPRDRGWAQELVYGTLRLRGRLDHLLAAVVRHGLDRLEPDVLDILRLGAYQLREMTSVPAYAAVSQSQELARAGGIARAVSLVGGVLHALQRVAETIPFPDFDGDPVGWMTSWGSHPGWLAERWVERWGREDARALVEANNTRPELYVRLIGIGADEARRRLAADGIEAERVALAASALRIAPPATALQVLERIPAVVQDPAAALVVDYAAVPPGALVLDVCAAPGGKALALAADAGYVAAADVSPRRLARLAENAGRLRARGRIGAVAADARRPPFRAASATLVLLDAPCSGTGTFRRHPDGRWRLRPEHLPELAALQLQLLESAAGLVRPGGWLVYATCSLEAEENEMQVERFLNTHPGWVIDPADGAVPAELLDGSGRLHLLPQRHGVDGAFAARLRRFESPSR